MTTFVLYEDRPEAEVGLRLAICSLARHAPNSPIVCHKPWISKGFDEWAKKFDQLIIVTERPKDAQGWNSKPNALIPVLENGGEEAIWIDSDMLVTRDPRLLFRGVSRDTIGVTEEPFLVACPNAAEQAMAWGWPPGRKLKTLINSSVVRVTGTHLPLLKRWREALMDPVYREYQKMPFDCRPRHMMSDQDVLFSLLGTREYAEIPLKILYDGTDVLHCGGALGYSFWRRLGDAFKPVPTFLHAIAGKPWWIFHPKYKECHTAYTVYYRRMLQEISPYTIEARFYRELIGIPMPWLDQRTMFGLLFEYAGLRHHALMGLPVTTVATCISWARQLQKPCRRLP